MLHVTLAGLRAHKRRLVATFAAVVLGVAFLSGILVQITTIQRSFDDLFAATTKGTDAVVRRTGDIDLGSGQTYRGTVDGATLLRVADVPGVADAEPTITAPAVLLGSDGKELGGNGPPQLGTNWISDPELNTYRLAEGRAPRADDEIVIDRRSASDGHLRVGATTRVLTPDPVTVRVVGIATFGSQDSAAGVTASLFSLHGAERHLGRPGAYDSIVVRAGPGLSEQQITDRLAAALPKGTEAVTGAQLTAERQDTGRDVVGFLRPALLTFAVIALLVASFSIYNTFSIIVAQRSRESALLRAIGASRSQTLRAVIGEALIIGVLASAVGIGVGLGVAALLKALFSAFGFALPADGLVVTSGTVITSGLVGLLVTMASVIVPAVRSSRIPPIAALRDVALDRTRASRARVGIGSVLLLVGVAGILRAALGHGGGRSGIAALGAASTLLGVTVAGPLLARPVTRLLGGALPRLRGITGGLARENAMRNPKRTAGTASALMIGVAVVTLFTVFAATIRTSVTAVVDRDFGGDLVVSSSTFDGGGMSPKLVQDVARLPQVQRAAGIGSAPLELDGKDTDITYADPRQLDGLIALDAVQGRFADLTGEQIAISTTTAQREHWRYGQRLPVQKADGTTGSLRVGLVYEHSDLMDELFVPRSVVQGHGTKLVDDVVLAKLASGVSLDEGRRAVERVAAPWPSAKVQDRRQYTDSVAAGINQLLALVYVMLALSIVIALMGIANALSLATFERTRELGLLRAVGQHRRQTRAMVRWEAVLVSGFGTVLGLGLGVLFAWGLVRSSSDGALSVFAVPGGQLAVVLLLGAAAGVLAALRPAARAAELDPLRAIATD